MDPEEAMDLAYIEIISYTWSLSIVEKNICLGYCFVFTQAIVLSIHFIKMTQFHHN